MLPGSRYHPRDRRVSCCIIVIARARARSLSESGRALYRAITSTLEYVTRDRESSASSAMITGLAGIAACSVQLNRKGSRAEKVPRGGDERFPV